MPFVPNPQRRRALTLLLSSPLLASPVLLSACGAGGDDDAADPQLRMLNLSEVSSLDLYLDDSLRQAAVAQALLGSYADAPSDEIDLALRRAGGDLDLSSGARTLAKDSHYTLLAYGRESALGFLTLGEDEDADDLDSGKGALRVFNASADVGALDVYLTTTDAELDESVATHTSLSSGLLSGFRSISAGTYRLRVTGAGDSLDLRLDLPALTIKNQGYAILVITGGSGGVLVHAGHLQQQGDYTAMSNDRARLRVIAGATSRGVVSSSWMGRSVSAGLVSPSVGPYTLVEAGSGVMDVRVAGVTVSNATRELKAGADYSLLVYSDGSSALIADDNRLPTSSSRARLRLIHGATTTDLLTLSVDYAVALSDVAQGSASTMVSVASGAERRLDVTAASVADALYSDEDATIYAGGVYSVFVLGGAASATGLLRKDR